MTKYTLSSMTTYWLYVVVMPLFIVAAGMGIIWINVLDRTQDDLAIWWAIPWFGAMAWGVYRQMRMPHTIQITDEGMVRFVGAFRTTEVAASNIVSIKAFGGQFASVKHSQGKILLLTQFTGLHEFLTSLEQINPRVILRGL